MLVATNNVNRRKSLPDSQQRSPDGEKRNPGLARLRVSRIPLALIRAMP